MTIFELLIFPTHLGTRFVWVRTGGAFFSIILMYLWFGYKFPVKNNSKPAESEFLYLGILHSGNSPQFLCL